MVSTHYEPYKLENLKQGVDNMNNEACRIFLKASVSGVVLGVMMTCGILIPRHLFIQVERSMPVSDGEDRSFL